MKAWTAQEVAALGVTTDVVTAANVLGIGRTTAYQLVRAGEWPTPVLRLGARYRIPTSGLLVALGLAPS